MKHSIYIYEHNTKTWTKTNSISQDRLTPSSTIRDFSPNPSSQREQTLNEFSEDRLPRYATPRTFITKVHHDQRADARVWRRGYEGAGCWGARRIRARRPVSFPYASEPEASEGRYPFPIGQFWSMPTTTRFHPSSWTNLLLSILFYISDISLRPVWKI